MIEISKKVIITRDSQKAAPLMKILEHYGVISYALPVTKIIFEESKAIPEDLEKYNCIAFTSANAVSAFSMIMNKNGLTLERRRRIFAVGASTSAAAERVFWKPEIVPEKSDGASLAGAVINNISNPESLNILWPCGADALPDFEDILSNAGARVTRFECYRKEAYNPENISSRLEKLVPWDLVFFAAPSAVRAFADAWEDRSGFIAAAIGPTTEKALVEAGYENIVVSKGTSVMDCAGTIIDALNIKVWS